MILQLWQNLKTAEATAVTVVKAAETAYDAAYKAKVPAAQLAVLDPGPHGQALGAIRTAITQAERILGPSATSAAKKAAADAAAASTAAAAAEQAAEKIAPEKPGPAA